MPPTRLEPCEILCRNEIPCLLWLEDAIARYNVPTCVFDLFLLVGNPDEAAECLRRAGWIDVESAEARSCNFLVQTPTIAHYCLKPIDMREAPKLVIDERNLSLRQGPTTVLLSAQDCNVSLKDLSLTMDAVIPPLPVLMDSFISSVLDAPPDSELEGRLGLQLSYLYGYCADTKCPTLVDGLHFENRQFHTDALTGQTVAASGLLCWHRLVRRELVEGKRQLTDENSLCMANAGDYDGDIVRVLAHFQPLQA